MAAASVVTPALFEAGTDATPWRQRGIPVYGVYPYPISHADLLAMHGNDERVSITGLEQGTDMLTRVLTKRSATPAASFSSAGRRPGPHDPTCGGAIAARGGDAARRLRPETGSMLTILWPPSAGHPRSCGARTGDHRPGRGALRPPPRESHLVRRRGQGEHRPSRPMRTGDRIRAGSIMKPFVAAATLQLVEEGKIALDDPLPAVLAARLIARSPEADRITVRMLLNHTSGIAEYSDAAFDREVLADPRRRWRLNELLDRAAALPRTGAPASATRLRLQPARPDPRARDRQVVASRSPRAHLRAARAAAHLAPGARARAGRL